MDQLNTSLCDKEPIHQISKIQDVGFLVIVEYRDLNILQGSENLTKFFGLEFDSILKHSLCDLLPKYFAQKLQGLIKKLKNEQITKKTFTDYIDQNQYLFSIFLEEHYCIIEFSQLDSDLLLEKNTWQNEIAEITQQCQSVDNLVTLAQLIVQSVKKISHFDRVMFYKFNPDDTGTVLAQQSDLMKENFVGLRFPASDIPVQARALYVKNRFRFIEDVNGEDIAVLPTINDKTQTPLDMSFCTFRSVSPLHIAYLKNMGVSSSMSLSIVIEGKLWGLIACHHYQSLHIPAVNYENYILLSELLSSYILQTITKQSYKTSMDLQLKRELFANSLMHNLEISFFSALKNNMDTLGQIISCDTVAIFTQNHLITNNGTLSEKKLSQILQTIKNNFEEQLFCSDRFGDEHPHMHPDTGGILAVKIPYMQNSYLLYARLEEVQTVSWAGEPKKEIQYQNGQMVLNPRKSFEIWQETCRGRCAPFSTEEKECSILLAQKIAKAFKRFSLSQETRELKAIQAVQENIILQNALEKKIFLERERLLNSLGEAVLGVDLQLNCYFVNPKGIRLLGFKKEELINHPVEKFLQNEKIDTPDQKIETIQKTIQTQKTFELDQWIQRADSSLIPVKMICKPLYEAEKLAGVVVSLIDITDEYNAKQKSQKLQEKLQQLAITDPLTQLYNERYFKEFAVKLFQESKNSEKIFSITEIELDPFKRSDLYNENETTELMLMMITQILHKALDKHSIPFRIGCKKFALILPNREDKIKNVVELIKEKIESTPVIVNSESFYCTVSTATVEFQTLFNRFSEMLHFLELKLYLAKQL